MKGIPGYQPEMIVLALCCGGTCFSHVNDAGFWLVNQYFGMTVPQTLKSWTAMKVVASVVGLARSCSCTRWGDELRSSGYADDSTQPRIRSGGP